MQGPFDLSGRVALVTGGSRGMGREICLALAKAGADVVVTSRNLDACESVAQEIRDLGRRSLAYSCHVGRWNQLDGLVEAAYAEFGKVDVLVNNAGKSPLYDDLRDVTEDQYDSVIGLNLKAPFRLSVLVGTRMAEGDGGSIINISSISSIRPSGATVPYAGAKAGVNATTLALAQALAPNVRVNCIIPGAFRTDVSAHWTPEVVERMEQGTAMQRIGKPDEIAGAVVYLASDAAGYTNGALLRIDGGIR